MINPPETGSTACYLMNCKEEIDDNERRRREGFFFAGGKSQKVARRIHSMQMFVNLSSFNNLTYLPDCNLVLRQTIFVPSGMYACVCVCLCFNALSNVNCCLDKHQLQQPGQRRAMQRCTQPWPPFRRRGRSRRGAERGRERASGCLRGRSFCQNSQNPQL